MNAAEPCRKLADLLPAQPLRSQFGAQRLVHLYAHLFADSIALR